MTTNPPSRWEDGPIVVSVCYAPGVTDVENEVLPIAIDACAEEGVPDAAPRRWKRTYFLNECPLFKAMRAAYICDPAPVSGPASRAPDALTGSQDN